MNKEFAIGIPTVNCADLLAPSLERYYKDFPNTFFVILDNGGQKIPVNENTTILRYGRNLGVSTSWNTMAVHIFYKQEIPKLFILNDDVYWGRQEDEVMAFVKDNHYPDFITADESWCNFLLFRETFEAVGRFDELFMAYFEDNDFSYRLKQKDLYTLACRFLVPDLIHTSMSIKRDPSLRQFYQLSEAYYIRKWGGKPGHEIFTTPFGIDDHCETKLISAI